MITEVYGRACLGIFKVPEVTNLKYLRYVRHRCFVPDNLGLERRVCCYFVLAIVSPMQSNISLSLRQRKSLKIVL